MKKVLSIALAGVVAFGLACNSGSDKGGYSDGGSLSDSGGSKEKESAVKPTKPWKAEYGTATIKGVVKFEGKAPKRRPIDMGGKPECAAHAGETPLDETIIVNNDGTLKNVFIFVRKGVEEYVFPVPEEPVILDQKGCTFHPHVIGVRAGQSVMVRNSDTCSHNVRSTGNLAKNPAINFMQTRQGKEDMVKFVNSDVFIKIKCDVHGWMGANIGVVDNPFFAITGDDGKFELKNLPKGDYTIEARHEEFGSKTMTVKVGDKEAKDIDFSFSRSK